MFTLQSLMLVALGILLASLIVIGVLPSYRRRIQRLTSDQIRGSIPLTEAEIRADKDKLRAQYAIRVHKLEAQGEQYKLFAARQRIEMNRRDASITELRDEHEKVAAALEEHVNARRVLEHTVTDRLPRLEQQLESARALILERDQEMTTLKLETTRNVRALDDAMQMNAQQRGEIERITASQSSRAPQTRESFGDPKFEGEIAVRSEIEALRAKTREQAQLIVRMQSQAEGGDAPSPGGDVERLKRELSEAELALRSARDAAQGGSYDRAAAEAQAKALNAKIDEQAAEAARLNAALATYEGTSEAGSHIGGIQGSRLASKARINALQAQATQQNETIQRLRAELAASNERLARQAAHYREEMRRLGSGVVPTSVDGRRTRDAAPRRGLADRISHARPSVAADSAATQAGTNGVGGKIGEYIKALTNGPPMPASGDGAAHTDASTAAAPQTVAEGPPLDMAAADDTAGQPNGADSVKRKLRLMERISGGGKA